MPQVDRYLDKDGNVLEKAAVAPHNFKFTKFTPAVSKFTRSAAISVVNSVSQREAGVFLYKNEFGENGNRSESLNNESAQGDIMIRRIICLSEAWNRYRICDSNRFILIFITVIDSEYLTGPKKAYSHFFQKCFLRIVIDILKLMVDGRIWNHIALFCFCFAFSRR